MECKVSALTLVSATDLDDDGISMGAGDQRFGRDASATASSVCAHPPRFCS
jgi:hypothetical protein